MDRPRPGVHFIENWGRPPALPSGGEKIRAGGPSDRNRPKPKRRWATLVLSRRLGETVVIGEHGDIVITVVELGRGKVRLGIEAVRSIPIARGELLDPPPGPDDAAGGADGG